MRLGKQGDSAALVIDETRDGVALTIEDIASGEPLAHIVLDNERLALAVETLSAMLVKRAPETKKPRR